jgi:hypothetical protein
MAGWYFRTARGIVSIRPVEDRWCIFFEDENLGSYHSPRAAADDASGGHTFTPSNGVDLGTLGIPEDINEWERL